ncbi:TPA: phosphoheptose isomerase, partial [Legionella pneumophila]|nr:phosphoheptose isomerase [Legionella pneumophila]HAT8270805.1 phosphoheptose isomerase [Legionella pneumophila]
AKSKTIILFNSSQAFYIGFLASLKNSKDIKKKININKPILKLVK